MRNSRFRDAIDAALTSPPRDEGEAENPWPDEVYARPPLKNVRTVKARFDCTGQESTGGRSRLSRQWIEEANESAAHDDDFHRGKTAALRQAADELDIYGPKGTGTPGVKLAERFHAFWCRRNHHRLGNWITGSWWDAPIGGPLEGYIGPGTFRHECKYCGQRFVIRPHISPYHEPYEGSVVERLDHLRAGARGERS